MKAVNRLRSVVALSRTRWWRYHRSEDVLREAPALVEEKVRVKFLSIMETKYLTAAGAAVSLLIASGPALAFVLWSRACGVAALTALAVLAGSSPAAAFVVPGDDPPPPSPCSGKTSLTAYASAERVKAGQSVTLNWSANAPAPCTTSVLLNGAWVSSTGSQVFQPVADTTWSLQAYDPGGWISRTVSVAVDSPPPESKRTVTIPTEFIQLQINLVLFDTTVQLSFFDSDGVLSVPVVEEQCENRYDEDVDQCLEGCQDLPPKNQGECRDDCRAQTQICYPVCSANTGSSFIRWGDTAKALSAKQVCDATTCPACASATDVPSLQDTLLGGTFFESSTTVGPFTYEFTCFLNNWQFRANLNIKVTSSESGLRVSIPGTTGNPSIPCDNNFTPNIEVTDLGIGLFLRMDPSSPWPRVIAQGDLLGQFHTLLGVPDATITSAIKSTFREVADNRLNKADKQALFLKMFHGLIDKFLTANHLEPRVGDATSIRFSSEGMIVDYYVSE